MLNIFNIMEEKERLPEIKGLKNYKLFKEKFWEKRNEIFDTINRALKGNGEDDINIIEIDNFEINYQDIDDRTVFLSKKKLIKKYLDNLENYNNNDLKKYNLELEAKGQTIRLVYKNEKNGYCQSINNNNLYNQSSSHNNQKIEIHNEIKNNYNDGDKTNNLNKKEEKDESSNESYEIDTNNNYDNNNIQSNELDNNEDESFNEDYYQIFKIEYLLKIKIDDQIEWICNPYYALYLIFYVYKLKNAYHRKSSESSNSLLIMSSEDIDKLVIKNKNKIKSVIEIKGDLNLQQLITKIRNPSKYPNFINEYITYSLKDPSKLNQYEKDENIFNEVYRYFEKFIIKKNFTVIFNYDDDLNTIIKMKLLKDLHSLNQIRYIYINLKTINSITNIIEKKKYLAFLLITIFNNDYKNCKKYIKEALENIQFPDYLFSLIKEVNRINNILISNYNNVNSKLNNYDLPNLHVIIDNINNENDFDIFRNFLNINNNKIYKDINDLKIKFIGICNIETDFCNKLFISIKDKPSNERGYTVEYLNTNNESNQKKLSDDLKNYIKELFNKKNIAIFKEFIIILHFEEFKNECDEIDFQFLFKYRKYLNFEIKKDDDDLLYINAVDFKNEEIKTIFKNNYKELYLYFLNNEDDMKEIFGEKNGIFFEKQLIFDILTEKILNEENLNFKELSINTIYCMNTKKIDLTNYKDNNILFNQQSKTGEIYDFAIAKEDYFKGFQISNRKSFDDLKKLIKTVIATDFSNTKNALKEIKEYQKFSFGIITSKAVFDDYNSKKGNKEKTDYYLMKDYCQQNNYEFLIYDLTKREFFIENNGVLTSYKDFYVFNDNYKINVPNLNEIFKLNPIKIPFNKVKDNIFTNIENKNKIEVVGKFKYQKEFLDFDLNESNYGVFILRDIYVPKNEIFDAELIKLNEEKEKEDDKIINELRSKKTSKNINGKTLIHEEIIKFNRTTKKNYTPCIKNKDNKLNPPQVILFKTSEEPRFLQKKRKLSN